MANLRKKAFKSGIEYLLDVIERQGKKGKRPKFSVPIKELERADEIDHTISRFDKEPSEYFGYHPTLNPQFRDVQEPHTKRTIAPPRQKEHNIGDFLHLLRQQTNRDKELYHNMLESVLDEEYNQIRPSLSRLHPLTKADLYEFDDDTMKELDERGELGIQTLIEQLKRGEFRRTLSDPQWYDPEFSKDEIESHEPTVQSMLEKLLEQKSREK
tara:strand:+ start:518 stop:1156 length:639 start_codon:yes stop_codon:yes gene_type:complete